MLPIFASVNSSIARLDSRVSVINRPFFVPGVLVSVNDFFRGPENPGLFALGEKFSFLRMFAHFVVKAPDLPNRAVAFTSIPVASTSSVPINASTGGGVFLGPSPLTRCTVTITQTVFSGPRMVSQEGGYLTLFDLQGENLSAARLVPSLTFPTASCLSQPGQEMHALIDIDFEIFFRGRGGVGFPQFTVNIPAWQISAPDFSSLRPLRPLPINRR
jgi:hypothetical protein